MPRRGPAARESPRRARETPTAAAIPSWNLGTIAIESAMERERSNGRPLHDRTRQKMESRFGADFAGVRVHLGERAEALAESMQAAAFTSGRDVFFGRGESDPESARGNELLTHELAHVIQQRGRAPAPGLLMGGAGDRYEQEAAMAARQVQTGTLAIPSLSPAPAGLIQRQPKKKEDKKKEDKKKDPPKKPETAGSATPVPTWAGEFTAAGYNVGGDRESFGADIEITFTPNEKVDAEKIALVQSVNSARSGLSGQVDPRDEAPQPSFVKTEKDQEIFKSRLVEDVNDFGAHIDAPPSSRTPLAAMKSPPKGDESLGGSVPTADYTLDVKDESTRKHTQFGWRTKEKGMQPAQMGDIPRMHLEAEESGFQHFETTALAVEGVQKGTYYGSVKWGWDKAAKSDTATPIAFGLAQQAAPSREVTSASGKWNASTDVEGNKSIPLPLSADKVVSKESDLKNGTGKGAKKIASLGKDTKVSTVESPTAADKSWIQVTVTSGRHAGMVGWIAASELTDPKTGPVVKKKSK